MKNDSLLDNLKTVKYSDEKTESLRRADIVTYSRLLALLGDNTTEVGLRIELCWTLWSVSRYVDKRQVAGPLLAALHSNEPDLTWVAAGTIGVIRLKRAFPALSKLATDKNQPERTRYSAIHALGSTADTRALSVLKTIVADKMDNLGLRSDALEQTISCVDNDSIQYYIDLLSDSTPDLRFWAAYCLGQIRYGPDISPALNVLDQVVLSDRTIPIYWGWYVDREALLPFEFIYFRLLSHDPEALPHNTWIVSPAAEYASYMAQYRRWTETWIYETDPTPAVTLRIDKFWLMAQLQQRWATIAFDVREPKPQAYLFDFQLMVNSQPLIGGLHRDGYTFVLTGDEEALCEVVAWLRTLFAPDMPLFLYEWADFGIRLTKDITAQGIRQLLEKPWEKGMIWKNL